MLAVSDRRMMRRDHQPSIGWSCQKRLLESLPVCYRQILVTLCIQIKDQFAIDGDYNESGIETRNAHRRHKLDASGRIAFEMAEQLGCRPEPRSVPRQVSPSIGAIDSKLFEEVPV